MTNSNLQNIRKAAHISQSQLADKSGVNVRMIQKYEIGERNINRAEGMTLYRMASALNVQMEQLLQLDDE